MQSGLIGDKIRILFLCSSNSARSQMAEGFARARREPGVEVTSAGIEARPVHPMAIRVMTEAGVDLSGQTAKTLAALQQPFFDVVITLCSAAARECPVLPGYPEPVHWNVPDPVGANGGEDAQLARFRAARDQIRQLVADFFERGYLRALVRTRGNYEAILDHIHDGVLAHDMDQRILFFNNAAERITGYARDEVLNRKCPDIFPGGLCGGKCSLRDAFGAPDLEPQEKSVEIATKDGERRSTLMRLNPIRDSAGKMTGIVVAFRDVTREKALARRVGELEQFAGIIGKDHKMLAIFDLVKDLADSNVPVMIQGESGTGKELIAAAIHNEGRRAGKLFVPVNCGALPEGLLESELFGHVRGAFTGAIRDKKGRFELADNGTIFLDEIGDISPAMQVKLLRVLQEGHFERVGSEKTIQVDVRVISATNKDLAREIKEKRFREDLFYRLSVVPIVVPPLRDRRTDIPAIAEYILKQALTESGRSAVTIAPAAMDIMLSYAWPGNIRELQNWIQFALLKCKDNLIEPRHLPPSSTWIPVAGETATPVAAENVPRQKRHKLDAAAVNYALQKTGGNRVEAARLLGISRASLYRFLTAEGIP